VIFRLLKKKKSLLTSLHALRRKGRSELGRCETRIADRAKREDKGLKRIASAISWKPGRMKSRRGGKGGYRRSLQAKRKDEGVSAQSNEAPFLFQKALPISNRVQDDIKENPHLEKVFTKESENSLENRETFSSRSGRRPRGSQF